MKKIYFLFTVLFLCIEWLNAQEEAINLDEVRISDTSLLRFSDTQNSIVLSDSVAKINSASLTQLLNYNTPIYFKENGLGMVSSPSFRGTSAQQTAVIWNGINVNSQLTGQSDFSIIGFQNYDNIIVKAGGGSVAYGSSAIGGSIHLNNDLSFNRGFANNIFAKYGSYNTYNFGLKSSYSDEDLSVSAGFGRNASDNDYKVKNWKNENGQYYNNDFNLSAGYKINPKNILKFYSDIFQSERHFSLSTSKYRDYTTKSLIEWAAFSGKFISKTKVAYFTENYKFYNYFGSDDYDYGESNNLIAKYDLGYQLNSKIFLNLILDYNQNSGEGSNISSKTRRTGSASLFLKHKIFSKLFYELSLRQEITKDYGSPFLYSFGIHFKPNDFYSLKLNTSKNFRMPTFNDLYWVTGGNENLKSEKSYQIEATNSFAMKGIQLSVTAYYNSVSDLLRWIPGAEIWWSPENTDKVEIFGFEALLNWQKKFGNHNFNLTGTYAYTSSENKETKKQLIYVPYHKMTASLNYNWNGFSVYLQQLYNGKVYTTSSNSKSGILKDYMIFNAGAQYKFGKKNSCELGFQILNITDEIYESTLGRFMPERNYNIYMNINL